MTIKNNNCRHINNLRTTLLTVRDPKKKKKYIYRGCAKLHGRIILAQCSLWLDWFCAVSSHNRKRLLVRGAALHLAFGQRLACRLDGCRSLTHLRHKVRLVAGGVVTGSACYRLLLGADRLSSGRHLEWFEFLGCCARGMEGHRGRLVCCLGFLVSNRLVVYSFIYLFIYLSIY